MTRRRLIVPVILLLLGSATAQMGRTGNLHVRITFTNGRACTIKVRVQLMLSAGNTSVAENYTNDDGLTDFDEVEVGNYHLVVSGDGIETTDSGLFEVDNRHGTQFQTITVKRTEEVDAAKAAGATVAVQDMNIPKPAAKEFNKASDLIAREQWKKAIDLLNRALAIYPQYVEAYNNLGVVYARVGDRTSERAALQKALSINDHFAPAWVNLARMAIVERDFPTAETLLDKATALDPTDSQTLLILANVELMNLHYDQAIAHCQKAHSLGQNSHSLVHFIAARAYEHENRISDAIGELKTFLKEEPSGVRADAARKELITLQQDSQSAAR
jgi:tetratricopeptide (TPR) repeat protein